MVDHNDATHENGAARELVRRAYAADPATGDFDALAGLHRLRAAAHQPVPETAGAVDAPDDDGVGLLTVTSVHDWFRMARREGAVLLFGRRMGEVHVSFGVDDPRVSRLQGEVVCRDGQWWLRNRGRMPIRAASRFLDTGDEWGPLPDGAAQVFVTGSEGRQHMLALHVTSQADLRARPDTEMVTTPPRGWPVDQDERLVLVVVFQQYLRGEVHPRPLARRRAAEQLTALDTTSEWTPKRVDRVVGTLRARLSSAGVYGLTLDEVETLSPDRLEHNLITELMRSATLVPADLWLLERTE